MKSFLRGMPPSELQNLKLRCQSALQARKLRPTLLWSALERMLPMIPGELNADYRARMAYEQVLAEDRRRTELWN